MGTFEELPLENQAQLVLESDIQMLVRHLERKAYLLGRLSESDREKWFDLAEEAKAADGNRGELRVKLKEFTQRVSQLEDSLRRAM